MTNLVDERFVRTWTSPTGFPGLLAVVNNRPLGIRFMVTAFGFFLIGGVLALLMRIQLVVAGNDFMGPELYNQLFTMHGSTMMYLFAVPFLEGLALYLVPLMIGSRDVAFPRLSAFGYWTYLFGGLTFYASFIVGEVPDGGWFAYVPLSSRNFSGLGLDFWALGLSLVEVSGIVAALEIVVTVLKLRAMGMSIDRIPVFVWAILAAGLMALFAFSTLLLATLLLELDRTAGTKFFDTQYGGSSLLWQHLFWFFGHPEVYIIFLPATGIVSMVVGTFSRRLLGYSYIIVAILVTAFLSFGLWVHHMYTTGLPELSLGFFAAASLLIALASGAQIFAWIASMWGRRPRLQPPLMFVLGFIFIFVVGGMTGVMVAIVPFDWQVHDTYFVVAHFHYVLIGGVVFPILAGMYYWLSKFTGRRLVPWLGQLSFWLAFIGFNATFFPMHIMGFFGMPRRVYTYVPALELDGYNLAATVGSFVFGAAFAVLLIDLLWSLWRGEPADANPWGGDTLEWSTESPPPIYSFHTPPVVQSRHPLWQKTFHRDGQGLAEHEQALRIAESLTAQPTEWRGTLVTDAWLGTPQAVHYLPGPCYEPFFAALGFWIALVAVLSQVYLAALVGIAVLIVAVTRWLTPDPETMKKLNEFDQSRYVPLPIHVQGSRSLDWNGMLGLLAILGTVLLALLYSYFYLRLYSSEWPQAGAPVVDAATFGVAYSPLLLIWPLLWWAENRLQQHALNLFPIALALVIGCGLLFLVLSVFAVLHYDVSPRESAYGSSVYALSGFVWLLSGLGCAMVGHTMIRAWNTEQNLAGTLALQMQLVAMMWRFVIVSGLIVVTVLVVWGQ